MLTPDRFVPPLNPEGRRSTEGTPDNILEIAGDAGTIHMAPANAPILRKQTYAGHLVEGDWLERFPAAYVPEMPR